MSVIDTMKNIRCDNEDSQMRRCCYGPHHACACSFRPLRLGESQTRMLEELRRVLPAVRRFRVLTSQEVRTLLALKDRGLVSAVYVSGRSYDAKILPAGIFALDNIPR